MSIRDLIDSAVVCQKCGATGVGTCDCWKRCSCGHWIAKDEECGHPVHGPAGAEFLKNGYWVIGDNGRPYKTRSADLSWLRMRMDTGTLYESRKAANAAIRSTRQG